MKRNPIRHIKNRIKVTDYLQYRDFLANVYDALKQEKHSYSYLQFAYDLGFGETNVIRLVIAGKRKLSRSSAIRIAESLCLRNEERRYFLALVDKENIRKRSKTEIISQLAVLKSTQLDEDNQVRLAYFSDWRHALTREIVRVCGGIPTEEWLKKNVFIGITRTELMDSAAVLERIGLIRIDKETGKLLETNDVQMIVPSDETAGTLAFIRYHDAMLQLSNHAIANMDERHRELNALTVCVSRNTYDLIKTKLETLCNEIMTLEQYEQKRDVVGQLNLQLITVAQSEAAAPAKKKEQQS